MFQEIEVGKVYTGKVVSITQFGAFMEVLPGKDGLVHVSELAEGRTENVEDIVKKGASTTSPTTPHAEARACQLRQKDRAGFPRSGAASVSPVLDSSAPRIEDPRRPAA